MHSGEVIAGRFELYQLAGEGGMGAVYRARDMHTDTVVAVKVLHKTLGRTVQRFAREARVLATLVHPGIVTYLDHGTTPSGAPYLAMEWLPGEDLEQRLERGALSISESLSLALRAAEALDFAHRRGVVHRDIKPSNLFLVGDDIEHIKIVDFGMARLAGVTRLTTTGTVGTPSYMAPEQARGNPSIDARADVFALGCVLFQCLTGELPFQGEHAMAVLTKILLEEAPALRDGRRGVPAELDELVAHMLAKEPDQRLADGGAVAQAIAALQAGDLVSGTERTSLVASLTVAEQRIMSVVVAAEPPDHNDEASWSRDYEADQRVLQRLRDAVSPYDVHIEGLLDGSMVAMVGGDGMPTEQAARAARCALAMRAKQAGMAVVLATGRALAQRRLPLGEVIDRAVSLIAETPRDRIRIDELTAGLLDNRFEVWSDERGLRLYGEHELEDTARTLLGKPTPCVGRARELAQIEAVFDWCMSEPAAGVVMVTAEAGIGKSRLRQELIQHLREGQEGVAVLVAMGDPLSAGSAYALLAPALRRWAGILAGEPPDVSQQKLRTRIGRYVPDDERQRVIELMGELMGTHFPDEDSPWLVAARSDARLMADQVRAAWESWLRAECEVQPVLLVLEDLHWGDVPTVQLVDVALRSLSEAPLMVLALARPSVHQRFPNLWAERDVTEIRLRGLPRKARERLVRVVLGEQVSETERVRLVEQSGGNAFYLEELIRATAEGRDGELPASVLGMVQARLAALETDARRVLRAASVFGQAFWQGGVAALVGGQQHMPLVEKWLDELTAREIISAYAETTFPEEREYRFRHTVVREAAYAMLTGADLALGHRLAGTWLEHMGEQDALVLAEHFRLGDAPKQAIMWYQRAAQEALDGDDLKAALSLAEQGMGCGAADEQLGMLRLISAEVHTWLGANDAAQDAAVAAAGCFAVGSAAWFRAVGWGIMAASRSGRRAFWSRWGIQLRAAEPVDEDAARAKLHALYRAANILVMTGHHEETQDLISQAEQDATETRDSLIYGRICRFRGRQDLLAGDLDSCVMFWKIAIKAFDQAGDKRAVCRERNNLGFAYLELGAYDRAEAALRESLAAAEQMSSDATMAAARHNLGLVLARRGDPAAGLVLEQMAVEAFHKRGDLRLEGGARTYLAMIHLIGGALEAAEQEARKAVEMLAGFPALGGVAIACLAQVLLMLERPREALEAAEEGMGYLQTGGKLEAGEALLRLVYAEALYATGDHEGASLAIRLARNGLLKQAKKISDVQLRESFLGRVPENVRTLQLATVWTQESASG